MVRNSWFVGVMVVRDDEVLGKKRVGVICGVEVVGG